MRRTPEQAARTRVTAQLRRLRFDAGALSLNLIATVGRRNSGQPIERLGDVERLSEWCVGVALDADALNPALLQDLRILREVAHDVVSSVIHDRSPSPASVGLLNEWAAAPIPAPRLRSAPGGVEIDPGSLRLSGDQLQSVIARDLLGILAVPSVRARLRECDSEACKMVYLDVDRGKPRRWCSMQRCGNAAKAARHRARGGASPTASIDGVFR